MMVGSFVSKQRTTHHKPMNLCVVGGSGYVGFITGLSQVIGVAEDLLKYIDSYKVIVMKSTVPVGTIELICSILKREKEEGKDFDVVANPEFLREGKGLYDFFHPTRIVIGTNSDRALSVMRNLYTPFTSTKSPCSERHKRTNAMNAINATNAPTQQTP